MLVQKALQISSLGAKKPESLNISNILTLTKNSPLHKDLEQGASSIYTLELHCLAQQPYTTEVCSNPTAEIRLQMAIVQTLNIILWQVAHTWTKVQDIPCILTVFTTAQSIFWTVYLHCSCYCKSSRDIFKHMKDIRRSYKEAKHAWILSLMEILEPISQSTTVVKCLCHRSTVRTISSINCSAISPMDT